MDSRNFSEVDPGDTIHRVAIQIDRAKVDLKDDLSRRKTWGRNDWFIRKKQTERRPCGFAAEAIFEKPSKNQTTLSAVCR